MCPNMVERLGFSLNCFCKEKTKSHPTHNKNKILKNEYILLYIYLQLYIQSTDIHFITQ